MSCLLLTPANCSHCEKLLLAVPSELAVAAVFLVAKNGQRRLDKSIHSTDSSVTSSQATRTSLRTSCIVLVDEQRDACALDKNLVASLMWPVTAFSTSDSKLEFVTRNLFRRACCASMIFISTHWHSHSNPNHTGQTLEKVIAKLKQQASWQ